MEAESNQEDFIVVMSFDSTGKRHLNIQKRDEVVAPEQPEDTPQFDPVKASAKLLLITTMDNPDERELLIREIVNAGMEDYDSVQYLALVLMPLELVQLVHASVFSNVDEGEEHRNNLFVFANDTYYYTPLEEAHIIVKNALMMNDGMDFMSHMKQRMEGLQKYGIEARKEFSERDLQAAQQVLLTLYLGGLIPPTSADPYLEASADDEDRVYLSIKDEALARFIMDSSVEDFREVGKCVIDRQTLSLDVLEAIVRSDAPSISSGIL